MIQQFNQRDLLDLTGQDGRRQTIQRKDVAEFKPHDEGGSIVFLKKAQDGSTRNSLRVLEDCAEIARRINGEPRAEDLENWKREAIENRRRLYVVRCEMAVTQHRQLMEQMDRNHALKHAPLSHERDKYFDDLEKAEENIKRESGIRLRIASVLMDFSCHRLARVFAGRHIDDVIKTDRLPAKIRDVTRQIEEMERMKAGSDKEMLARHAAFLAPLIELRDDESFRDRPGADDDKRVCDARLERYHAEHRNTAYLFVRDAREGVYYNRVETLRYVQSRHEPSIIRGLHAA